MSNSCSRCSGKVNIEYSICHSAGGRRVGKATCMDCLKECTISETYTEKKNSHK